MYKEISSTGTTIKDKKQILVIKDSIIYVYDGNYDFTKDRGFVYLPQNGTASKRKNNELTFIYQYASDSFIIGEGTSEEYSTVRTLEKWYNSLLTTCNISQKQLSALK